HRWWVLMAGRVGPAPRCRWGRPSTVDAQAVPSMPALSTLDSGYGTAYHAGPAVPRTTSDRTDEVTDRSAGLTDDDLGPGAARTKTGVYGIWSSGSTSTAPRAPPGEPVTHEARAATTGLPGREQDCPAMRRGRRHRW